MKKYITVFAIIFFTLCIVYIGYNGWKQRTDVIKIGLILPLSGGDEIFGKPTRNGVLLAIEQANSQGGINGKTIELIEEDSQGKSQGAVSAFQKISTTSKPKIIIGPLWSPNVLDCAQDAEKKRITLLSPGASLPNLSKSNPFIFRNIASDDFEARAIAKFAREDLGIAKVAILYVNNEFGIGASNAFEDTFTAKGGQVVIKEKFNKDESDFKTQLTKIKASSADSLYLLGYSEMTPALIQFSDLGLKLQVLGFTMYENPSLVKAAPKALEGAYYTFQGYDPDEAERHIRSFVSAYEKRFGNHPDNIFSGLGYDAGLLAITAIKNSHESGRSVRDELASIQGFQGVTGLTSFDSKGDVQKTIGIKEISDGGFEWIRKSYMP